MKKEAITKEDILEILGKKHWSVVCDRLYSMSKRNEAREVEIYITKDYHFNERKHRSKLSRFNGDWKESSIVGATAPRRKSKVSPSYIWAFVR
jgi:hypothetical protein